MRLRLGNYMITGGRSHHHSQLSKFLVLHLTPLHASFTLRRLSCCFTTNKRRIQRERGDVVKRWGTRGRCKEKEKSVSRTQVAAQGNTLELEQVGLVGLAESELVLQEGTEELNLGDVGSEGSINLVLDSLALRGQALNGLLGGIEEGSLGLLLLDLLAGEEGIIDLGHIDVGQVNLGGGGDDVSLVHAAQRNTVDAVRTCYEEKK